MEAQISKYDPARRNKAGHFLDDDWTSIHDISAINGPSLQEYLSMENKYWRAVLSIINELSIEEIEISSVEYFGASVEKYSNQIIDTLSAESRLVCDTYLEVGGPVPPHVFCDLFKAALREVIWFNAKSKDGFYVRFGHDYYCYVRAEKKFKFPNIPGIWVEKYDPSELELDSLNPY